MTARLTLLLAAAAGVIAMNLFAAQPLVGIIGPSLGLRDGWAGAGSTLTLLGSAAGLVLLVPLADIVENRRLIVAIVAGCALALGAAASAQSAALSAERERVVGNGLMLGILLSRPAAGELAAALGWRAVYGASALLMVALSALLARTLPIRRPARGPGYLATLGSLWTLWRGEPVLRARSISSALCFTVLSMFWSTVALRLAAPPFGFDAGGIALFALAGAGGALIAPIAGCLGDRGWTRQASVALRLAVAVAVLLAGVVGMDGAGSDLHAGVAVLAGLLIVAAVGLDAGTIGEQTLGRRAITLLRPDAVGRLNGLFTGLFFVGGALGSFLAELAWGHGGWSLVCAIGVCFGLASLKASGFARSRVRAPGFTLDRQECRS
jgi:predicted MFS family arabinose efflux permease